MRYVSTSGVSTLLVLLALLFGAPGCVFFELRDALLKTRDGIERTNSQLGAAATQIGNASRVLSDQAVPAMNSTAGVIRDAKEGMSAAANLAEPMREMKGEMEAMRSDLQALKGQLAEAGQLIPALQKAAELREPMMRVAELRDSMNNVAALQQPMTDLTTLRDPMRSVAELREPLSATGQLVEPMRTLAKESQSIDQTGNLGRSVILYAAIGLVLWMLATAFGVYLGVRFAK